MTKSFDAYWDELGVAWRAINPDPRIISPRLESRLRRQGLAAGGIIAVGLPMSIGGSVLGAYTIWYGWSTGTWNFVTRGIAIVAISWMLAVGAWSLRIGRRAAAGTLAEMIDLAISRAENARDAIRWAYYACAVGALFGLLGYLIRTHSGRPPAMSPVEPLVALALCSVALLLYRRHVLDSLKKFRYLQRALLTEDA
jgi:hypothetical protein